MLRNGLLTILIFVLFPLIGFADDTGGAKIGLVFGFSVPDADNTTPKQMWGVVGDGKISPNLSLGGYYLIADKSQGSGGRDFKFSVHGLALTYHQAQGNGDAYYGIKAGLSKVETNDGAGTELIFSPYHYGIVVGYDYSVWSLMSLGFEGNYLTYQESNTTTGGVTYIEKKFSTISFIMSAKFIFK